LTDALSGRYSVERELGRGGMAIVYYARDLKHDRPVAIKVFKPELAQAIGPDRFLREIRVTAQLSHPHILPLLDSGEADGLLFYVTPYIEGESLRHRLERDGKLPLDEALRITREVADGLESAHRRGVIHRDVKPENILLEEDHAVIADFGIARAVAESSDERLTATGIAVGTPEYMSPEQMMAGRAGPIDARTDVYALACVLYELLTGTTPKHGTMAARAEIPEPVSRVIRRAMSDDPDQRFNTVAELAAALPRPYAGADDIGAIGRIVRRPAYAIPAALLVLAAVLAVILPGRSRAARERGRGALARAALLADSGRYDEAYTAWTAAERALPGDSAVGRLLPKVADILTVTSEPAGARVYAQRFVPDAGDQPRDSVLLGETPIRERRMARGDYRLVIAKDGFLPFTTLTATYGSRHRLVGFRPAGPVTIAVRLPADSSHADMVFVPGGTYRLVGPKMPLGIEAGLDDYFIDRYEVSNEQYRAFVAAGGYHAPALQRFTDQSGMAEPRGWSGQEYAQGQGRHPVSDVSWLEAAAYCAAAGKRLPTVFEWEKAARNGVTVPGEGVMMPWGYVRPGDATSLRANFGGSGIAPVDAYPFGISTYGAYNMAGNVKEWTANPLLDGYGVTGGSWEDPIYLYSTYGALGAGASSRSLGFRCARVAGPVALGHDQGAFRIPLETRTPRYTPVSAAAFRALLDHYRYDSRPLEASVLQTVETPDWTRHRIRYVALEGDTVLAYLYLPRQATAPFQTIVYICSSAAFAQVRTVPEEVEWAIGPNIRAGRAVLAPVLKGMAERGYGPVWEPPVPSSVRFRDLMVFHATEMRRGIDYLATRHDIDMRRLIYVGLSWGAGSRLALAGVDDRFAAVVLLGGGIDERVQPTLPEASNINFAPYIQPPKLLLNGRDDEEHPWLTRALPLWNLLREPKQLVLVPGGGHMPPLEARVPAINTFLDKTLGPVRR
jgi:formylglycine-generating enzyme required for sulfatase activity/tRNA A-37 threonylcarbamoyl transferase component Bud32